MILKQLQVDVSVTWITSNQEDRVLMIHFWTEMIQVSRIIYQHQHHLSNFDILCFVLWLELLSAN